MSLSDRGTPQRVRVAVGVDIQWDFGARLSLSFQLRADLSQVGVRE